MHKDENMSTTRNFSCNFFFLLIWEGWGWETGTRGNLRSRHTGFGACSGGDCREQLRAGSWHGTRVWVDGWQLKPGLGASSLLTCPPFLHTTPRPPPHRSGLTLALIGHPLASLLRPWPADRRRGDRWRCQQVRAHSRGTIARMTEESRLGKSGSGASRSKAIC